MIEYFKTVEGRIEKQKEYTSDGVWVNSLNPSESELRFISKKFGIDYNFLKIASDEEESSHIDIEDGIVLIVIDFPVVEKIDKNHIYYTMPLGIFITQNDVITISLKNNEVLDTIKTKKKSSINTKDKTNFVLNLILQNVIKYLRYLNKIIKTCDKIEHVLRKAMKNKELIQLLEIKKSLVYFSSSLKTMKVTVEKLFRSKFLTIGENDRELLDDVIIELKQAIEMSDTYLNILSGTMEAFASIISNNLNIVMKILASVTLIISIPTVISGIYGMNTPNFPMMEFWWFPVILSFVLMYISYIFLKKKDMF
ncbi:MAG: magnesium transporter CorA family protein [Candidatus Improbicoccus pseudotrichonymphae]|uniref:Magnesium transporter CorA family protein n=1 Tax=Candidatus Improbicoccus pseudotrichonymphae TaxID=3033792 RepID=A0AA48KX78_9FIRM|nr:MAG: magnesium transporter CorA family protein [Candidatus Improbicoccus pseudotrichonymphae]